jgi:hypothetical protein
MRDVFRVVNEKLDALRRQLEEEPKLVRISHQFADVEHGDDKRAIERKLQKLGASNIKWEREWGRETPNYATAYFDGPAEEKRAWLDRLERM